MVGREIAVRNPEIPLQLDGIARDERRHGVQSDGGGERDVGSGDFSESPLDPRRAVQHEPPAHPRRGASVILNVGHIELLCDAAMCKENGSTGGLWCKETGVVEGDPSCERQ